MALPYGEGCPINLITNSLKIKLWKWKRLIEFFVPDSPTRGKCHYATKLVIWSLVSIFYETSWDFGTRFSNGKHKSMRKLETKWNIFQEILSWQLNRVINSSIFIVNLLYQTQQSIGLAGKILMARSSNKQVQKSKALKLVLFIFTCLKPSCCVEGIFSQCFVLYLNKLFLHFCSTEFGNWVWVWMESHCWCCMSQADSPCGSCQPWDRKRPGNEENRFENFFKILSFVLPWIAVIFFCFT